MESNRRSPTKKALLIGISYCGSDEELLETNTGVMTLKSFLTDHTEYQAENITLMTDAENTTAELRPTKLNVLNRTRELVADAIDGDHFLFYFAGHSYQVACKHKTEDDNEDEVIMCSDFKKIKDNKLHKILVNKLPNKASLTAIFDSCHSGTLLDLEHYACNDVFVPWLNKGKRKNDTIRNSIRRQNAASNPGFVLPPLIEHPKSKTVEAVSSNVPDVGSSVRRIHTEPQEYVSVSSARFSFQLPGIRATGDVLSIMNDDKGSNKPSLNCLTSSTDIPVHNDDDDSERHSLLGSEEFSSPLSMWPRYCDGNCRDRGSLGPQPHPHVVSLSSSKDSQITWEDTGASMTAFLVEILKKNGSPSYHDMMTELQHKLHSSMMEMHRVAKEKAKEKQRRGSMTEVDIEMNDFQDPQLGSISPLNMDDPFIL